MFIESGAPRPEQVGCDFDGSLGDTITVQLRGNVTLLSEDAEPTRAMEKIVECLGERAVSCIARPQHLAITRAAGVRTSSIEARVLRGLREADFNPSEVRTT